MRWGLVPSWGILRVAERRQGKGADVDSPQEPRAVLRSLGLWDCWVDRDTGSQLYSFTIITTRANALVRGIHDRMPVIYDASMGRQWLETSFGGRFDGS
jgi:putative SOS response-associated peptidase YedK